MPCGFDEFTITAEVIDRFKNRTHGFSSSGSGGKITAHAMVKETQFDRSGMELSAQVVRFPRNP